MKLGVTFFAGHFLSTEAGLDPSQNVRKTSNYVSTKRLSILIK